MNRQIEMEKDMSLREYRWSCNYLNILECKFVVFDNVQEEDQVII